MEDQFLNERQSLDVISQMIRNTQNKMEHRIGRPLLILGYLSLLAALLVWYANRTTGDYRWNFIWFLVPLIGWSLIFFLNRKQPAVTTYVDRIIRYVWLVFAVGILIVCCMAVFLWDLESLFVSALMLGMMAAMTGLIVRIKSIAVAGFAGMLLSPVTLFLEDGNQILAFAVMFVLLLIIPGHILDYRSKKQA